MSTPTPRCHHCQAPGGPLCPVCKRLRRELAHARTHYERRRNLHTITEWPPELHVKFSATIDAPLLPFPAADDNERSHTQ